MDIDVLYLEKFVCPLAEWRLGIESAIGADFSNDNEFILGTEYTLTCPRSIAFGGRQGDSRLTVAKDDRRHPARNSMWSGICSRNMRILAETRAVPA